jgi:alkanesulfonate monooxygenase SsuD/methylene tetrahydromethanopterin reductase-like flavin-dependent oxidoreductase (luciferase family)
MEDVLFGFQAAAAGEADVSDRELYRDLIADCALGHRLGYDAAWLLEHHFSDYYPTPSPLLLMAYIAAKFPDLSLGTSVLVLPWYHPLRLAEEIAMLNGLTQGTLHLGIGRGTAKMEYDAYNVDMNEGRARFAEVFRIVEQGLSGKPFSHHGKFWNIERPIRVRPDPIDKPVHFYGAIGSPASAEVMGDLGIPPICLSTFPDGLLTKILARWRAHAGNRADGFCRSRSSCSSPTPTRKRARWAGVITRPILRCRRTIMRPMPIPGPVFPNMPTSAGCSPICAR